MEPWRALITSGVPVAGVDEAGRGPLAGDVVAGAVILAADCTIPGLDDSKKLSAARREELAHEIRARALAWSVARATVEEIDRLNILRASLLAMSRAVDALGTVPAHVLVDGNRCPAWQHRSSAIVQGDALVPAMSICLSSEPAAAASRCAMRMRPD